MILPRPPQGTPQSEYLGRLVAALEQALENLVVPPRDVYVTDNVTPTRAIDASAPDLGATTNTLATLIADLQSSGFIR